MKNDDYQNLFLYILSKILQKYGMQKYLRCFFVKDLIKYFKFYVIQQIFVLYFKNDSKV